MSSEQVISSSASTMDDAVTLAPPFSEAIADALATKKVGAEQEAHSETSTLNNLSVLSNAKKLLLLLIFSMSQFIDVMNVSACFVATSAIAEDIGLGLESSAWIITSYSMTFAAFLLLAGRLADLYSPQKLFLTGFMGLGILCIGISFATNKYAFLVLRAIAGIFGSLTIPAAINIIVHLFPNPAEQQKYLGIFQLSGALGNVLGLLFAGLLELASWNWIFRFIAIIVIPLTLLAWLLLPPELPSSSDSEKTAIDVEAVTPRYKKLDIIGSLIILVTLVLFILGLTEGNIKGWTDAGFLAPFLISMAGFPAFFFWEAQLSSDMAILPKETWKIKNFLSWVIVALIPYMVWASSQTQLATYSQGALGHSPILTAVRVLPQGISALVFGVLATMFPKVLSRPRLTVIVGLTLAAIGDILMALSGGGEGVNYWKFLFTGYSIASFGLMMAFLSATVGLIMSTPENMAGVSGAFFNVLLQVGAVVGLSIQQGLFGSFSHGDIRDWTGSEDGFWMLLAFIVFIGLLFVITYRSPKMADEESQPEVRDGTVQA